MEGGALYTHITLTILIILTNGQDTDLSDAFLPATRPVEGPVPPVLEAGQERLDVPVSLWLTFEEIKYLQNTRLLYIEKKQ